MTIEVPAGTGRLSLARCVGDVDAFVAEHWGRAPLLRKGSDVDNYGDLFSLSDIDYLVSSTALRYPSFRLVKSGENLEVSRYTRTTSVGPQRVNDSIDVGRVWNAFHDGATIVLQGVQRFWFPLMRFCRDLELELTHPTQTNVYVTPPSSRALGVHYDTHDVFVLQIAGRKDWQVFKRLLAHPLQTQKSPRVADPGPPLLEATLEPG